MYWEAEPSAVMTGAAEESQMCAMGRTSSGGRDQFQDDGDCR